MAKGSSSQSSAPPPLASRRNFRLSPLEIMIGVLIGVAVLYLITVWFGGGSSREVEQAAPAIAPGSMVERAVASSEKVLAEQVELSREVGTLRKQLEAIQANRGGGGTSGAADASQDRRLDELEKSLAQAKRSAGPAPDLKPLHDRLDQLEKALKERPAPAADPQLAARLDKLEKRLSEPPAPAPSAPDAKLVARLEALEKAQAQRPASPAADPQLAARLDKLEKRLAEMPAAPAAPPADAGLEARLKALEAESAKQQAAMQRQVKELSAELERQEKGVAADRRLAALERRLSQLEQHPAAEPRRESRTEVREEPRPAPHPEPRVEAKPVVKSAPRHEPEPKRISHKVKSGETLMGLSRRYKVSVDDIVRWNAQQLGDRRLLWKGETIVIYASGQS